MSKSVKEIKSEVLDLLNQIAVLTKGCEPVETNQYDYSGEYVSLERMLDDLNYYADDCESEFAKKLKNMSKEEINDLKDQEYLVNVHAASIRISTPDGASYNEKQYYNSNC